jgi:hypothetical protein
MKRGRVMKYDAHTPVRARELPYVAVVTIMPVLFINNVS